MDTPRYIIRTKAGAGQLYINTQTKIFMERNKATMFTRTGILTWISNQDNPENFTIIDLTTGKEFSSYDGPPSDSN